jgi:hypothetical protein
VEGGCLTSWIEEKHAQSVLALSSAKTPKIPSVGWSSG